MGLPVRQRRVLDRMDRTLRGTDPRLAALYAIFGRLTLGEEIPRFEQLRHGIVLRLGRIMARFGWLRRILAAIGRRLHIRRVLPRQRIVLFYPLAIALTVGSIVLAVRSGPVRSCMPVRTVAAGKNVARSHLCHDQRYAPLTYGH
jgi:hypothetical protein